MYLTKSLIVLLTIIYCSVFSLASYAEQVSYSVSYSKNSKYTDMSLKHTQLEIQLYTGGDPHGLQVVTTNEEQSFVIDDEFSSLLTVEVLSIKGQPEQIQCQGVGFHGDRHIEIDCQDRM